MKKVDLLDTLQRREKHIFRQISKSDFSPVEHLDTVFLKYPPPGMAGGKLWLATGLASETNVKKWACRRHRAHCAHRAHFAHTPNRTSHDSRLLPTSMTAGCNLGVERPRFTRTMLKTTLSTAAPNTTERPVRREMPGDGVRERRETPSMAGGGPQRGTMSRGGDGRLRPRPPLALSRFPSLPASKHWWVY